MYIGRGTKADLVVMVMVMVMMYNYIAKKIVAFDIVMYFAYVPYRKSASY